MNNFKSLIENFERLCPSDAKRGYVCQCGTEKMLKRLREPEAMRAFLLVAIFIDQFIEKHYRSSYSEFSKEYAILKLHSHPDPGSIHPASWFIYSNHGYDKNVKWLIASEIAEIIVGETRLFLNEYEEAFDSENFEGMLRREIETNFEKQHQYIITSIFLS